MENFLNEREGIRSAEDNDGGKEGVVQVLENMAGERPSGEQVVQVAEGSGSAGVPKVELVTEGGTVVRILVTCTCGKCLELECSY